MSKVNYSMKDYRKLNSHINKNNIGKTIHIFDLRIVIAKKTDMKLPAKNLLVIGSVLFTALLTILYKTTRKTRKV